MSAAEVTLLGVRHHGPGSARAVGAALERLRPDVVLIEGPPEADAVVGLAADEGMVPPVALLAHAADDPSRAAFWPFASFSPEWVAIRYATGEGVPVSFIDLPAGYGLAPAPAPVADAPGTGSGAPAVETLDAPDGPGVPGGTSEPSEGASEDGAPLGEPEGRPGAEDDDASGFDPIGALAEAAGHADPEAWWEDVIEHRLPGTGPEADPLAPFAAVAEAMTALRERHPAGRRDELREAYMRQALRAAKRAGHRRIAVVCGAWHVPALATLPTVAHDRALLATLPKKARTEVTWVPWTHRRLSQHTGYGAGIDSPGWYHHLFTAGAGAETEIGADAPSGRGGEADGAARVLALWMTRAAELLRAEDHPVSSAHVIEAVRLAGTLAVLRGRPQAGLPETLDAILSVLCDGSEVALRLVRERLVLGDALGEVPDGAPTVPLQRDLGRLQRSLRLKPEPEPRELVLDLRKENDAARSLLLHRLRLIGIDWGSRAHDTVRATGTFRESWKLRWQPEFAVRIAVAAQWGTTVEAAATGRAVERAARAEGLPELTELVEQCLLAGLPAALPPVMRALADRAALDTDVAQLASALPALVRALRYGDVRGTDGSALAAVAHGLADRICVGLPPACVGLDAEQAGLLRGHLEGVHAAVALLTADDAETDGQPTSPDGSAVGAPDVDPPAGDAPARGGPVVDGPARDVPGGAVPGGGGPDASGGSAPQARPGGSLADRWAGALGSLARRQPVGAAGAGGPGVSGAVPGLLRGRAVRLLLDGGRIDPAAAGQQLGLVLSPANPPADTAGWVEGFLAGSGVLLLHDPELLALLDRWLTGVPDEVFTDVLPLLRRTFAALEAGVRRTVGEQLAAGRLGAAAAPSGQPADERVDEERAAAALPVLRLLLGLPDPTAGPGTAELAPDGGSRPRIPRQTDRRSA
ncbi:DUF5682 family protein [Kitasatospora sp. NPDC096147]|uniref:DUF5682 family protein n=1 Tax=Kitasatospora sp. NPDC096147 TaxID=3364093 RepID=UPI00380C0456